MAEVVLRLTAESAAALAQMKQFTRGVEDAWKAVRAGDSTLQGSSLKVLDLTRAKQAATTATTQWTQALGQLPGPLGNATRLASTWLGLLRGPAGLAIGLGAVAAAGVGLAKSMANNIERLENLKSVTGLAVAALETFEHIAAQAGEAPEGLVRGLGAVNTAISDVIKGGEGASKTFATIGVDLRALVQSGASTEQVLEATAKAIAGITDPTRQAAAMADIFGTRSKALQIALQRVAVEGIGPLIAEMRRLGIVTGEGTIAAAKHVDAMADRFDEQVDRMIKKAKQYAVEAVSDFAKVASITVQLFGPEAGNTQEERLANAARRGRELRNELDRLGEDRTTRAGVPSGPRATADTAAEIAAAKAAADFEHKMAVARGEARVRDQEFVIQRVRDIEQAGLEARQAAELGTQQAIAAAQIAGVDAYEARQNARQALDTEQRAARLAGEVETVRQIQELTRQAAEAVAAEQIRAQQETTAVLAQTSTGRLQAIEAEREKIRAILDTSVIDVQQTEDLKLQIKALTIERDLELEAQKVDRGLELGISGQHRMNAILETRVTAERRAADAILTGQALAAQLSGDKWAEFSARFGLLVNAMPTTMDNAMTLVKGTIQTVGQALEESLFQLIKGNLDDFDDIWRAALDAILREIIAFLSAAAVREFVNLLKDFGSGSRSTSSDGSSSSIPDLIRTGVTIVSTVFGQGTQGSGTPGTPGGGTQLVLEQQSTGEARKRVILEQQSTASVQAARDANAVAQANAERSRERSANIFGTRLDFGGPVDLARQAVGATAAGLTMNPIVIGINILKDFVAAARRASEIAAAAALAAQNLGVAQITLMHTIDRTATTTGDLDVAAQEAAQVTANTAGAVTNFSGDLSVLDASFDPATAAVAEMNASLGDLTSGLQDAGPALVAAVDAAREFAGQAAASASQASTDADRARAAAAAGGFPTNDPTERTFDTRGAGPGGGTGPGVEPSPPDPDPPEIPGRLHGGWAAGVPGYAPGGWVTDGVWGRDSVMAALARGEFVLQASSAMRHPDFVERYNANPDRALAGVAATGAERAAPTHSTAALEEKLDRLIRALEGEARRPYPRGWQG